jgi:hypothetical protein
MTHRLVFPEKMFLSAFDPSATRPTVILVDCCEICCSIVPKELSLEHKRWHLRQEEGSAR